MKAKLLMITFLSLIMTTISYGQSDIISKLARKTERSINKRIEKNAKRGVDRMLDSAEDEVKIDKKKKKNKKDPYEDGGRTEVIIEKEILPYNFSGNLIIDVESNGIVDDNLIKLVTDKFDIALRPMLVKKPNNLMIYNKYDESVIKVNNDKYDGQALKEFYTYEKENKTKFERTSDIRDINGFVARKYILDGKGFTGVAWLSPEVDIDYDLFASLMEYNSLNLGTSNGFPLDMTINYNNGDTFSFKVQEIDNEDVDKSLLDVSEYELIDMTDLKSER